jgi:hypothetical protein
MNPAVVAAVIAASVSLLTLIVSVVAQTYGIRKTSSGTEETFNSWTEHSRSSVTER